MKVEIVKQDKNEIEIKVDSVTIAEILRVYLNARGIEFAAWKREHLTEPAILKVESSGKTVKKEISEAVSTIKKDLDSMVKVLKK